MYGRTGELNPMYGRTGELNSMYGKVPPVNVYSLDNTLVQTFSSQVTAAKGLNVSRVTIQRYIKSSKVFQGKYIIRTS